MRNKLLASMLFCVSLVGLSLAAPLAIAESVTAEEQKYIDAISLNAWSLQMDALNQLQWAGLSSPAVYDLIEKKLNTIYPVAKSKREVEMASWYAKVLGTSGSDKYAATLNTIINSSAHRKIKKYTQVGLDNIQKYKRWNPIIRDKENFNPDYSQKINGFVNMIQSTDWELKRIAAKRIYHEHIFDQYLLDIVEKEVKALYLEKYSDKIEIDSIAWMAKAIAGSGNQKYKKTISEIADNAGTKKVKKYAKKYLKSYY